MILDTLEACNNAELAVHRYGRAVQCLAFIYLRDRFEAEDASQEVFISYFRKAPSFLSAQKEKAWLMKVTTNLCKSILRRKRQDEPLTEDLGYLPPEESSLMLAVLELEEKYRIPIHLHYYEGYSLSEIGKLLHCSQGTVASWLSRGRGKLKEILKEDYFEE